MGSSGASGQVSPNYGEHPGDHNHQDFPKSAAIQWEAYCNTNGGRTAIQMGAYRNPKTDLTRGYRRKSLPLKPIALFGGVARNGIANRAIVGH